MPTQRSGLFIGKISGPKRLGYALIAAALIFLTALFGLPGLGSPSLAAYSYSLLGLGFALILANKALEIIQYSRFKNKVVRCLNCGWYGRGRDWYRHECCPECDSQRVIPADFS
ncbi:MAG: hypothetical protein ACE5JX_04530 [Acidobacteriota bacterium]